MLDLGTELQSYTTFSSDEKRRWKKKSWFILVGRWKIERHRCQDHGPNHSENGRQRLLADELQ